MKQTPNLGLLQPEGTDTVEVEDISENMALIDVEVGLDRAHRSATTGVHGIVDTAQLELKGHTHPEIPAGPPGPTGPMGPQGPQGDLGPVGPQGPEGPIGQTGPQGPQGNPGPQGLQGPEGAASTVPGPQGPVGPAGPEGPQGPPGADSTVPGPTGPAGPEGPAGPPGADGAPGPQGPAGPEGPQGPQGPIGLTGSTGPKGDKGDKGDQGIQGPQGIQGTAGAAGPTGPQGNPGAPGTLGYTEWVIAGTTAIPAGEYRLTPLDTTITVPAGRRLKITAFVCASGGATNEIRLYRGTQQLNRSHFSSTAPGISSHTFSVVDTPAAGTHTYNVRTVNASAGTLYNDGVNESYLLVEDITYNAPALADPSVPVGVLAQAIRTADFGTTSTAAVDVPDLTLNISVPAGRTLKICLAAFLWSTVLNDMAVVRLLQDGVAIRDFVDPDLEPNHGDSFQCEALVTPSAGAHTYKVQLFRGAGTGEVRLGGRTTNPLNFWVEDVTPTPHAASTTPSSTLAYAERVVNSTAFTNVETLMSGFSATFTVPAGRRIKVTCSAQFQSTVAGDRVKTNVKLSTGTYLQERELHLPTANAPFHNLIEYIFSPAAGTHTITIAAVRAAGTGSITMIAAATEPAFLLIEDITGVGVSGHTHTQLDDSGWIPLPLINGWGSYDNTYGPPRYRKVNGVVYVQGLINNGTLGVSCAQLPVGFRPSLPKVLFIVSRDVNVEGRIDVQSDGHIIMALASQAWTSLAGIIFPADQ